MKKAVSLAAYWVCGLGLLFWLSCATAQRISGTPRVLAQFDETSLATGSVIFQRGVFRIEGNGEQITTLCIPVEGKWRRVGSLNSCGNSPPIVQQREISPFSPDVTFLGVRNLGITTEQWRTIRRMNGKEHLGNALSRVGDAFSYRVGSSDVSWRFDSGKLPEALKASIPNSGIHVHFGGRFSTGHTLPLFDPDGRALEVELNLAVPKFSLSGKAQSGLTVAVDLILPTEDGVAVGMPFIVSLLNSHPRDREIITSDTRVSFASSYLGPDATYLETVENNRRSSAWSGFERFAFRLTRNSVRHILADANKFRRTSGKSPLDESRLDQIRVSGITFRNESRFLDQGNVELAVVIDYLRVIRANH